VTSNSETVRLETGTGDRGLASQKSPDDVLRFYAYSAKLLLFACSCASSDSDLPELRALPSANTWSFPPRPHTHHVRWIEADVSVAHRVFVAIEAGDEACKEGESQINSLSRMSKAEFVDSESLDLGFQCLTRQPEFRSGAFGAADSARGFR
jgi:hypothetical protein